MGKKYNPGPDYTKIRVHLVYAVKHDGRHKARLVAGGHLTETPVDSVYSSVVSLRGIRILTFLAELNGSQVWATDIGSAYLESYTAEKVYIIAGPEFGDREGHTLIITKALHGLRLSSLRWAERFSDALREMGFFPSKAERDIWMRDKGDHYKSGIRPDDLKQWYHAAHPTDGTEPQTAPWDALVKLIQHIWDTGELPKELLWIVLGSPDPQTQHHGAPWHWTLGDSVESLRGHH